MQVFFCFVCVFVSWSWMKPHDWWGRCEVWLKVFNFFLFDSVWDFPVYAEIYCIIQGCLLICSIDGRCSGVAFRSWWIKSLTSSETSCWKRIQLVICLFFQFQIDRTTTLILFDLPSQRGDDSYCEKSITLLNSSSVIWAWKAPNHKSVSRLYIIIGHLADIAQKRWKHLII